jgi:hypothetical protein
LSLARTDAQDLVTILEERVVPLMFNMTDVFRRHSVLRRSERIVSTSDFYVMGTTYNILSPRVNRSTTEAACCFSGAVFMEHTLPYM